MYPVLNTSRKTFPNFLSSRWGIPLVLSLGLLFALYFRVLWNLFLDWVNDPNYSHGFLIPLVSIYLLWERRHSLKVLHFVPSLCGIPVLLMGGLLYVLGMVAGELFTQRISFVIILAGMVLSFGGRLAWGPVWAPVLYLVFMVPLPYILYDSIAFPLKLLATKLSAVTLGSLGVSIYTEGNIIHLPHLDLEVADACSGIRSLISIFALAIPMAGFMIGTLPKRIILIALAGPVVLVVNSLRIVITGLSALKDPGLAEGFFHGFSGEVLFLVGVGILWGLAWLLDGKKRPNKGAEEDHAGMAFANVPDRARHVGSVFVSNWAPPILFAFLLWAGSEVTQVRAMPCLQPLEAFPAVIGDFTMVQDERMDEDILENLGVDYYLMRQYQSRDGYSIWLYIGYYEDQKEGAMIHSPRHCYPGSGWTTFSVRTVNLGLGLSGTVNEFILGKGDTRQLVFYWYQSRGRIIANEYVDRFFMIYDTITKRRSDGALVRISGPADNIEDAIAIQKEFMRDLHPVLSQFLPSS